MPIKNFVFLVISSLTFYSCHSFKSKVELRNSNCDVDLPASKVAYLVNKSTDKSIKVTIREVEAFFDSKKSYQIKFYTLNPGDEKLLGCTEKIYPVQYETKDIVIIGTYESFGKDPDGSVRLIAEIKQMKDTVINGQRKQFYHKEVKDYDRPIKQTITKLSYEITGEVIIKQ